MRFYHAALLITFLFLFQSSSAQLQLEWAAAYGGIAGVHYYINDMITDDNGNSFIYGYVYDTLGHDTGIIIKYNANGVMQWTVKDSLFFNYGKLGMDAENNLFVVCGVNGISFTTDFLTAKIDSSGNIRWKVTYNGPVDFIDRPAAVKTDDSLNVYVAGSSCGWNSYYDYLLLKYDSSGVLQWQARYNFSSFYQGDFPFALAIDADHNVYVTGQSPDTANGSVLTLKYNRNGNLVWARRAFPDPTSKGEFIQISEEGYIYVGGTESFSVANYFCIKYDSSGVEQWTAVYDAQDTLPFPGRDVCRSMVLDDSGNVFLTGTQFYGNGISDDFATVKFNKYGVRQWLSTYDAGFGWDDAYSVLRDAGGNVYVLGQTQHSSWPLQRLTLIMYDLNGSQECLMEYPDTAVYSTSHAVRSGIDADGNIYLCGTYSDNAGGKFLTLKYAPIFQSGIPLPHEADYAVFPNPFTVSASLYLGGGFSQSGTFQLRIYDGVGKCVQVNTFAGNAGRETVTSYFSNTRQVTYEFERKDLKSGLYFFRVSHNESGKVASGKFLIE